jgi:hypothetical protein
VTLDILREFFFWNMVINMGLLTFSFIMIMAVRPLAYKIHGKLFALKEEQIDVIWYTVLAGYKIAIFVFNVVPYIALRIMT